MAERPTFYMPPEAKGLTEEQEQTGENIGRVLSSKAERAKWQHFTPEFVGTKVQEYNLEELVKQINQAQEIYVEGRVSQPEGRVEIKTSLPIAICHIGDLHLGSIYTNTDEVLRKFKEIKETPNMYCVLMSNLIDNGIPAKFPNNMLTNSIPPDKQVMMMRAIAMDLDKAGKILAAVTSPCHEGWTFAAAGQDVNALIFGFEERKFPVLENGGRLHLKAGKVDYMGAFYHMVGPYESNFNETHALRQLNRLNLLMEADWVAGAHKHFAAAQVVYEGVGEHLKTVAYIRSGTEKGTGKAHDAFTVDRYGTTGEPTGQTVFLWPGERKISAVCDFDTAVMAQECFYLTEMARQQNGTTD